MVVLLVPSSKVNLINYETTGGILRLQLCHPSEKYSKCTLSKETIDLPNEESDSEGAQCMVELAYEFNEKSTTSV